MRKIFLSNLNLEEALNGDDGLGKHISDRPQAHIILIADHPTYDSLMLYLNRHELDPSKVVYIDKDNSECRVCDIIPEDFLRIRREMLESQMMPIVSRCIIEVPELIVYDRKQPPARFDSQASKFKQYNRKYETTIKGNNRAYKKAW